MTLADKISETIIGDMKLPKLDNNVVLADVLSRKILGLVKEALPKKEETLYCGMNAETEQMEIMESGSETWGEDMSFGYNLYRRRTVLILDDAQMPLL